MQDALRQYHGTEAESKFTAVAQYSQNVAAFFRERLEFYLRDARGFAYDVTNAVLASGSDNAVDALARAQAVAQVRGSEDFDAISASFKRIKNILRQAEEKSIPVFAHPNEQLFGPDAPAAERDLYTLGAVEAGARYKASIHEGNYDAALGSAASLRPLLDRFFDDVMVMVEDVDVRANRLSLLKMLYDDFSKIADFSEIVTGGKSS
jgi:glycyl-tRNA synthetase beta chain